MTFPAVADLATGRFGFTLSDYPKGADNSIVRLVIVPQEAETLDRARKRVEAYDATNASALAEAFANRARGASGVAEVWYTEGAEPVVSVVTEDFDLERDLQLQAALVSLHRDKRPNRGLSLEIYAAPEGVPKSVRTGRRL